MRLITTNENRSRSKLTMPGLAIKLESVTIFALASIAYVANGFSWWAFLLLLFVPDLAIAVYAIDKQLGSIVYNLIHTYTLPLLLGTIASIGHYPIGCQLALIWLAHIAMDRALGYGLKYLGQFKQTHLSNL